jgi:hypothetical protein
MAVFGVGGGDCEKTYGDNMKAGLMLMSQWLGMWFSPFFWRHSREAKFRVFTRTFDKSVQIVQAWEKNNLRRQVSHS